MSNTIPPNWRKVPLGDVAEVRKGTSFTSKQLIPGNVPVIAGGRQPAYYHKNCNRHGETITVSASGAHAGFVAYHSDPIFATDCTTIRSSSDNLITKYIYHYLKYRQNDIYRRRNGSAQPHIYPRDLTSFKCLMPPLAEQVFIVETLDSIDKWQRANRDVDNKTVKLRTSILNELLTRGLPGYHTKWKSVPLLGTIPTTWQVVCLDDVCSKPKYGAPLSALPHDPGLPRYIRITDLTDDGQLHDADPRSVDPILGKGYELTTGDLLFARSGSVGRTYLYKPEDGNCIYAGYLIKFRPNPKIALPEFIELWTRSQPYKRWVSMIARTGAQPNINAKEYSSMPIPLPSLIEQKRLIEIIGSINYSIRLIDKERSSVKQLKSALFHRLFNEQVLG